jgi:hypothetical protein
MANHFDKTINYLQFIYSYLLISEFRYDMFGQKGHQCQATELWRIRQNHLNPLNQILGD